MIVEVIIAHYHQGKIKKRCRLCFRLVFLCMDILYMSSWTDEVCTGTAFRHQHCLIKVIYSMRLSVLDVVPVYLYETFNGVNEARYGTYTSNDKNGNVKEDMVPQQIPPLQLQVEEAW